MRRMEANQDRRVGVEEKWNRKMKTQFLFLFCYIGVQLINGVVLVSGVEPSDSVTHILVSLLFQKIFPIYNTVQKSLLNF